MKKYLFSIIMLGTTACSSPLGLPVQLADTGEPALHAVQSERLKNTMRDLEALVFERMLNEVQIERQRRYQTAEIVKISDQLLRSINAIPDNLPAGATFDTREQQLFLQLSNKLKQQVQLLKQEAEQHHVEVIPARANTIIATCNACHELFRSSSAPQEP